MGMFCYQCQEAAGNKGCTVKGVCGKEDHTANLQDLLVYALSGLSGYLLKNEAMLDDKVQEFILKALFVTVTNVNFNDEDIIAYIDRAVELRNEVAKNTPVCGCSVNDAMSWQPSNDYYDKAAQVGIRSYSDNEDVRSLKSLLLYGIKGIAAYGHHAYILGYKDPDIVRFIVKGLASLQQEISLEEALALVEEACQYSVKVMELLDKANTETYGHPEIAKVYTGTRNNPGILISGHDLKDLAELLEQTKGTGVDVYTHGEMLPAHGYPAFRKYDHLVGNYGNSWWHQHEEFESFNGPILMTTNCLVPPKDSYKERVFTTGVVSFPGCKHIPDREEGKPKDFSEVIEMAKKCKPPEKLEDGHVLTGLARNQVLSLADKIIDAVKSGKIKKFVVMAGCDGRFASREYFTEVAKKLPSDTVILTAGCAKYRYNKLPLGDIDGIPRVVDAGQCNDSYSLAYVALKLKEAFGLDDINDLPLAFDVAWYEQKAVTVLLALLGLGFKDIRLGPTLPAFLSANVAKVLVERFKLMPTKTVDEDVAAIVSGK